MAATGQVGIGLGCAELVVVSHTPNPPASPHLLLCVALSGAGCYLKQHKGQLRTPSVISWVLCGCFLYLMAPATI